ncbi:tyrosine-type recombinase/integrase [Bacillus clarus]|uniref:Phage integrase family protein n=2 Tax=Bacillus clarus TaxID=2338372 RepID=A0A090ZBF4_9BACI|nr:phage integrase family protein [Bacillus clarus]
MLAYTGLRIGELVALKWSDIDFDEHTLRVIKTYYNPTNNKLKYTLLTPKTEGSIRTITIDPLLVAMLIQHKQQQEKIIKDNKPFIKTMILFSQPMKVILRQLSTYQLECRDYLRKHLYKNK